MNKEREESKDNIQLNREKLFQSTDNESEKELSLFDELTDEDRSLCELLADNSVDIEAYDDNFASKIWYTEGFKLKHEIQQSFSFAIQEGIKRIVTDKDNERKSRYSINSCVEEINNDTNFLGLSNNKRKRNLRKSNDFIIQDDERLIRNKRFKIAENDDNWKKKTSEFIIRVNFFEKENFPQYKILIDNEYLRILPTNPFQMKMSMFKNFDLLLIMNFSEFIVK